MLKKSPHQASSSIALHYIKLETDVIQWQQKVKPNSEHGKMST